MTSDARAPQKLLAATIRSMRRTRREEEGGEDQDWVLWLRLLTEGSRWNASGGALGGFLLAGGGICYALTRSKPAGARLQRAWVWVGRRVVTVCRWNAATLAEDRAPEGDVRLTVSQLESEVGKAGRLALERRVQRALDEYRPGCTPCGADMYRDRAYERSFLSRIGELCLSVPVFKCPECDAMTSGMDLVGEEALLQSAAFRTDSSRGRFPRSASDRREDPPKRT